MSDKNESGTILILGGTKEAAELAQYLVEREDDIITSLAGRTKEPRPLAGKIRSGGFGGPEGLADWLCANNITRVIDATHPFAEQISRNAVEACAIANVPLEIRRRPPWCKEPADHWLQVSSLDAAASAIPKNARVLLALGSQHLTPFHHRNDVHFTIRMVDSPKAASPFENHRIILGKPSTDWRAEAKLLEREHITHIICRNSGGSGAYAKIEAARQLAIPVIIINMPS